MEKFSFSHFMQTYGMYHTVAQLRKVLHFSPAPLSGRDYPHSGLIQTFFFLFSPKNFVVRLARRGRPFRCLAKVSGKGYFFDKSIFVALQRSSVPTDFGE